MRIETSTPVTAGQFFDRREPLDRLDQFVEDAKSGTRRWLAVMGHRKIGKTSLLLELMRRHSGDVPMSYTDCWEIRADPMGFFTGMVFSLIRTVVRHRKQEARLPPLQPSPEGDIEPRLVQALARLDSPVLDEAVRLHHELVSADLTAALIRAVFELPEAVAGETAGSLVVILDEFQELDRLHKLRRLGGKLADVFGVLRTTWQQHRGVCYLVAGSKLTLLRQILTEEASPFYQHFEILYLGPFPRTENLRMLREVLHVEEDLSGNRTIERILDLLGDHPFYVRALVAETGLELGDKNASLSELETFLKTALQTCLFEQNGRLSLFMEERYRSVAQKSTTTESILRGFVEPARVTDVAEKLKIRTGAVSNTVKSLLTQDVLAKRPDGLYVIADSAFAVWLQHQVDFRQAMPPLLVGTEAEQAVARRLAADGFRGVYQSRASRGAFDLLALHDVRVFGLQVKKRELPYRLGEEEWTRMREDSARMGFHPVLALVTSAGVRFYDLGKRKRRGDLRFHAKRPYSSSLLEML